MKFLGALAFVAVMTCAMPSFAATSTIDFSGVGTNNGDPVDFVSASGTDFHFETRSGFGKFVSTVAPNVKYRADADYSHHQALYSATDDGVFELIVDAGPGKVFTDISFGLGGFQNATQTEDWSAWTANFGTFFGNGTISVDGTSGTLLTFSGINASHVLLQFGKNANVGLISAAYTTTAAAVTPIPGAILLFGTSLAGLLAIGRRTPARG